MIDRKDWNESDHPRGQGGRFASSGAASSEAVDEAIARGDEDELRELDKELEHLDRANPLGGWSQLRELRARISNARHRLHAERVRDMTDDAASDSRPLSAKAKRAPGAHALYK